MNGGGLAAAAGSPKGSTAKRAFWDVEYREQEPHIRPMTAEERLQCALLIQNIQDAKGTSPDAHKECLECHNKVHPACVEERDRGEGEKYLVNVNRRCPESRHSHHLCAKAWLASNASQPPFDKRGHFRTASGFTVRHVCETLGINLGYLRKSITNTEYEAYWKNSHKIQAYLEHNTGDREALSTLTWEEASRHGRRSSNTDDSD